MPNETRLLNADRGAQSRHKLRVAGSKHIMLKVQRKTFANCFHPALILRSEIPLSQTGSSFSRSIDLALQLGYAIYL